MDFSETECAFWDGEGVFACKFPVADDSGYNEVQWIINKIGDEFWLHGDYGQYLGSFAKFSGVPDLVGAKEKAPDTSTVQSDGCGFIPNAGDFACDSRTALDFFGCGLVEETYRHD